MRALLVILPLALAGAYFWLSHPSDLTEDSPIGLERSDAENPGGVPPREGTENSATPDLRGIPGDTREKVAVEAITDLRYPLEIHLSMIQPGSEEANGDGAAKSEYRAGAKAALRGHVHTDDGTPLTGRVLFVAGANKGRELTCSSDGNFQANDLYPGLSIVRVLSGRGQISEREVRLGQFGNTELNVAFGARSGARVRGRVQDGFGKAIVGATVRVDGQEGVTNEEGRFDIYRTTSGKILLVIYAAGYSSYREQISIMRGRDVEPDRLLFQLEKEAILDVEVLGLPGGSATGYVYLFPAGGQRVNTKRGQRTFPWHTVNPIEVRPGLRTTVRGLPQGAVTVMGFHASMEASPTRRNVKLNAGQRATASIEFGPGPSIKGKVLLKGKPAVNARIRLESMDANQVTVETLGRRNSFSMEMVLDILPTADRRATSNAAGRFVLATQPGRQAEYMLWATSANGKQQAIQRVKGSELDGNLEVELQPIESGLGSMTLDFPGMDRSLPCRIWVDDTPQEVFVLSVGESLQVEDLAPGQWRMDVNRFQNFAARGLRFWVPPGKGIEVPVALPEGIFKDIR